MSRWLLHPATRPLRLILLLLVLWDIAVRVFNIQPYLVPPPLAVVKELGAEWPMLLSLSLPTLHATLSGFAASALIGVPIAMWIAYSRTVESFVYPQPAATCSGSTASVPAVRDSEAGDCRYALDGNEQYADSSAFSCRPGI